MAMDRVFTGKNATISLSIKPGTPEEDAAGTAITAYGGAPTSVVVGRATGVHVAISTNLHEFHQIGQRHAVVLHPGDISISGSLDHAYVSGAMIALLLGKGAVGKGGPGEPFPQPAFDLTIQMRDPAFAEKPPKPDGGPSAQIVVTGVKFQNWGFQLPEDDFVMENITFRALALHLTDIDLNTNGAAQPIDLAKAFPA